MADAVLAQAVRISPAAFQAIQGLENREEDCLTHQQLLRAYKHMRALEKDTRELLRKANAAADTAEAKTHAAEAKSEQ